MAKPTIVWTCMISGPEFYDHATEGLVETSCTKQRGHDEHNDPWTPTRHEWWNDEGTVKVEWEGTHPFNFGDGSWREEAYARNDH